MEAIGKGEENSQRFKRLYYCSKWVIKKLSDPRQDPTPCGLHFLAEAGGRSG